MPVIDTYTIFGSWPSGGADLSLERLVNSLAGRDIKAAIAHSTDAVFQTTLENNVLIQQKMAEYSALFPAAVVDPTLAIKPWEDAAKIAAQPVACIRFFPEVHNWPVGDYPPFYKCLEAIAPQNVPVSVAITAPGQISALAKMDIARGMTVILAHLADDCVSEIAAILPSLDSWYVSTDGLTHLGLLEELVQTIGSERILFGSAAPRGSIEGSLRYVKLSSISDGDKEAILYSNAARVFGGRLATH